MGMSRRNFLWRTAVALAATVATPTVAACGGLMTQAPVTVWPVYPMYCAAVGDGPEYYVSWDSRGGRYAARTELQLWRLLEQASDNGATPLAGEFADNAPRYFANTGGAWRCQGRGHFRGSTGWGAAT